jgi:hypothetical protein
VRLLASHGLRDEAIQLGSSLWQKNDGERITTPNRLDRMPSSILRRRLCPIRISVLSSHTVTPREVRAFRKGIATALLSSLACDINTSHVCPDRRGACLCQCVGLWPAGGLFPDDLATAFQAHRELEVGGVVIGDVPSYRADQMPYGGVKESALGAKAFGTRWRTTHTSGFYC